MPRFFRMHREQKLACIERHQREWPEPTVYRLNVQVGEARMHRIRVNSTPHLTAQAVMMQGAKDALIASDGMHLGKIEFLPPCAPLPSRVRFQQTPPTSAPAPSDADIP